MHMKANKCFQVCLLAGFLKLQSWLRAGNARFAEVVEVQVYYLLFSSLLSRDHYLDQ